MTPPSSITEATRVTAATEPDFVSPSRGWYLDEVEKNLVRYWDGSRWTGHAVNDPRLARLARRRLVIELE